MNLFRTLSKAALLVIGGAGASSCLKAPDYPVEPTITFNTLTSTYVAPSTTGALASQVLEFATDFQDGDGDLGLDVPDTDVAPYKDPTGGHNNLSKSNNYFIQPFKKVGNTFVPFYTPVGGFAGEYDGRYPRLETTTDSKPAPLKGTLRYKLVLLLNRTSYLPGDTFRFEISLMDRAFHQSNTVTSTEVKLGP